MSKFSNLVREEQQCGFQMFYPHVWQAIVVIDERFGCLCESAVSRMHLKKAVSYNSTSSPCSASTANSTVQKCKILLMTATSSTTPFAGDVMMMCLPHNQFFEIVFKTSKIDGSKSHYYIHYFTQHTGYWYNSYSSSYSIRLESI